MSPVDEAVQRRTTNVLLAGVGGQGVLLASETLHGRLRIFNPPTQTERT